MNVPATTKAIEREIQRRAEWHKPQTHIVADYYRIRRKVAYPLPLREMYLPKLPVPGIPVYPWSVWVLWDFEDRINSLGWAATWFGDEDARALVRRDLEALAGWPRYWQYKQPDLSLGHCARLMWLAYSQWDWLGPVKKKIETALARIVAETLEYSDQFHGRFRSKADILALDSPHSVLANIPLIGTVGIALAARAIGHESIAVLDQRLHAAVGAILDLRGSGHSEGVAYDGYIMDFVAHWLQGVGEAERAAVMDHPRFGDLLDESVYLSAPGEGAQVVPFGDVEPKEMPFHLSAHAKFLALRPNARAAWLLKRCRIDWLRADALGILHGMRLRGMKPPAGTQDAHYAVVLRSGWEAGDIAVAMAASNSPMGHLQADTGTLCIGSGGRWMIDDPGYQQYMVKREREFTVGPSAHNMPVINGRAQERKPAQRSLRFSDLGNRVHFAEVEMTTCYPETLDLTVVARSVWLVGRERVVVADRVTGQNISRIDYFWHGHPEAGWWVADNWARIYCPNATLWFSSPQTQITDAQVDRLPGSRGQLSLCATADTAAPFIWWIFGVGDRAPEVQVLQNGHALNVNGRLFEPPK